MPTRKNRMSQKTPDYGIDAPHVQQRLLFAGLACLASSFIFFFLSPKFVSAPLAISLSMTLLWPGISMLICAGVMFWGSKVGKIRLARKLIDQLSLRGDEQVLDVGCGHGLMLITAAKRLGSGKASGIDLWQSEDQAGNSPEATLRNAQFEGVADRIELKTGDARELPFADNSFDAIVSSWALHNIYEESGRTKAVQEIARVLRPAGRVAIVDTRHSKEYSNVLTNAGFEVSCQGPSLMFLLPSYWLLGRKPATLTTNS